MSAGQAVQGRGPRLRAAELALAAAIFAGSLLLWIGIPAAWLWLVARLSDDYPTIYAFALVGCPLTMVLWGLVLARMNALYVRLVEGGQERWRAAWLESLSGGRPPRRPRSVLDVSMTVSVIIAVAAFLVWVAFFAGSPLSTPR